MIIRRPDNKERPTPVKRVLAVGLAGLIIAALLNAGSILERSKEKPFGRERDVWVAVWTPIDWVSRVLQLDQPRLWLDDALGRDEGPGEILLPTPTLRPGETPQPGETPAPPTPVPTPLPVRQPTAEQPLRLWVGGDSQAQVFGESMVSLATDTGLVDAELDYRISSGLTRPDYFNWPAHLAEVAGDFQPDVMVIVFGANDSQGIETDRGEIYQPLEDGWRDEYRRRVAGTMDLLSTGSRRQVWVGQPISADGGYSERMADINAIISEEADKRPSVEYFDTWSLFVDSSGDYASFLPDEAGVPQDMRQGDGIHLTRAGGDRLAKAVLDIVGNEFNIGQPYTG